MSDAEARRSAVRSYDRNVVVVAGAGTGKTSLLIERLLHQLVEQELSMGEIAAITFTERAAAELRTRLDTALERLAALARHSVLDLRDESETVAEDLSNEPTPASRAVGAARSEPQASVGGWPSAARGALTRGRAARAPGPTSTEADRAYAALAARISRTGLLSRVERLLGQTARASIDSIHGYCASLLRRFPSESGVDPDFAIDDGPLFDALREEIWEEFLCGRHGPEGELREAWRAVLLRLDLGELREIGWRLASFELPAGRAELAPTHALLTPLIHAQLATHAGARGGGTEGPESYLHAADRVLETFLSGGIEAFRGELRHARFASVCMVPTALQRVRRPAGGEPRQPGRCFSAPRLARAFRLLLCAPASCVRSGT